MISELSATIGYRPDQGAMAKKVRESATIRPQSGVGGDTPKPKKDSELKASSIQDQRMAPSTMSASSTLGSNSRRMMAKRPWPRARAASTKSRATTL